MVSIKIKFWDTGPGGALNFFSGRGVPPRFPKCGACELIFASERGGLWAENFQIWGLASWKFPNLEACEQNMGKNWGCSPGGGSSKNSYGDAQSRVKNFDHLYTSKSVILPSLYHFSAKSTQFGANWVLFLAKFSKIHPILQIGRIGYVTKTHPSIYQNLRKCTSKPLSIPVYHLSVRTPS